MGAEALYFDVVDAPSPESPSSTIKLGVRHETFQTIVKFRQATALAQYYDIVKIGIIVAEHAFRGLMRPLMHNGDMRADESVLIYSWKPQYDSEWTGTPYTGSIIRLIPPPAGRVFVVLVRESTSSAGSVHGTIEHWNWVREDPGLKGAPIDHGLRYKTRLWSRSI